MVINHVMKVTKTTLFSVEEPTGVKVNQEQEIAVQILIRKHDKYKDRINVLLKGEKQRK
jgi:hypothetical protein